MTLLCASLLATTRLCCVPFHMYFTWSAISSSLLQKLFTNRRKKIMNSIPFSLLINSIISFQFWTKKNLRKKRRVLQLIYGLDNLFIWYQYIIDQIEKYVSYHIAKEWIQHTLYCFYCVLIPRISNIWYIKGSYFVIKIKVELNIWYKL